MDAARKLTKFKNNRGMAIVYLAILLFVLVAFVGLAVDIGYMYVVKGQLQNAADASALAGAARLNGGTIVTGPGSFNNHSGARREAWRFACKNRAAGSNVVVVDTGSTDCGTPPSDLNNNNAVTGDIIIGNWDGATFRPTPSDPLPAGTLLNAIKVTARRTSGSPQGPVEVFFGQIFRYIGADWSQMSAASIATAARPPRADGPIAVCVNACTMSIPPGETKTLYWAPFPSELTPEEQGMFGIAWTNFTIEQSTNVGELSEYFCGKNFNACGQQIASNNGVISGAGRQFYCAFKNPNYSRQNKTYDGAGNVTSWTITVPVFDNTEFAACPPGQQPTPHTVIKYARIRVTHVYASGGGGTNYCACGSYDAPTQTGPQPNAILIDKIECVDCGDISFLGSSPVLVQ